MTTLKTIPQVEARAAESRLMLWHLFLLFLGLKLAGAIDWSWWLVTLPLWLIPGAILVFGAVVCMFAWAVSKVRT